jgi:hypothetical protein
MIGWNARPTSAGDGAVNQMHAFMITLMITL